MPSRACGALRLTFDAFAKGLVDRFGQALPERWRPTSDYGILFPTRHLLEDFIRRAAMADDLPFHRAQIRHCEQDLGAPARLGRPVARSWLATGHPGQWIGQRFWDEQLHQGVRSTLTFPMLTRLAELLVRVNVAARHALALTYSHVFMDEFQDTTQAQFDLVKTIFLGTPAIMTAVGDNKQQIMRWALAMDDPFTAFEQTFGAQRIPLLSNYRSSHPSWCASSMSSPKPSMRGPQSPSHEPPPESPMPAARRTSPRLQLRHST